MKKTILFLLFISLAGFSRSQDTSAFRRDLKNLIAEAQNEFTGIQGKLEYEDTLKHKKYFNPSITLGSNDHFIQQLQDASGTYRAMICSYNLTETSGLTNAIAYLPVILDELNTMHSSGKYKGRDYKEENGTSVTELTDAEGNYIMELASTEQAITLRLYAKSWGKR
ncbi:MAG: hypothetical protein K0Q95_2681 [Bacteroidota bacterium]|jgi:hypothetical protein|nr:hypothetical protein [Bacteroidota bacterium]